jgi:glycosyltransferase involved in cell wall biosynthesis
MYVITEDWFFASHFLDRARAAVEAGWDVVVATRCGDDAARIRATGARTVHVDLSRRGTNPLVEVRAVAALVALLRRERPDVVHHVALKPVVLGTLAARCAGVRRIVNAPVGMGYVFTSTDARARAMRPLLRTVMRLVLNPRGSRVIIENPDDRDAILEGRFARASHVSLVKGAGVDLRAFVPSPEPSTDGGVVVTVVARMLRDKGIPEFVEAARALHARGVAVRCRLVGGTDTGNPTSLDAATLRAWEREGIVEWLGPSADVPAVWRASHVACLPSHREGLPKSLIEAAACARPIVTTDVPGCREVVRHEVEGLLVPARDAAALADAIATLAADPTRRARMGAAARARVEAEFGNERVIAATHAVYEELMAS